MINIYARVTFALVSFLIISPHTHAQLTREAVTEALEEALQTYLVGVLPHISCPCNNCEHTYTGNLQIERTGRNAVKFQPAIIEQRVTVWGTAEANQVSNYLGSEATIVFYAELRELAGVVDVVKLKWKQSDCMQYAMLLNKDDPDFWPDSTQVQLMLEKNMRKRQLIAQAIAEDAEEFGLVMADSVHQGSVAEVPALYKDMISGAVSAIQEESHEVDADSAAGNLPEGQVARMGSVADAATASAPDSLEAIEPTAEEAVSGELAEEDTNPTDLDDGILIAFDGDIAMESPVARIAPRSLETDTLDASQLMVAKSIPIPDTAVIARMNTQVQVAAPADDLSQPPHDYLTIEYSLTEKSAKKGKKKSDEQDSDETATHILAGEIISKATDNRIKDAVLELSFYSKTDTKLSSETRILYEFFVPGESTSFSFELTPPPYTDHPTVTLLKATWVEKEISGAP